VHQKSSYASFTSKKHIQWAISPHFTSKFDPYKMAFNQICVKVCTYVINNKTILSLSLLKGIYIQELSHNGVTVLHYCAEKLKHHIETELGNKVGFYIPEDTSCTILLNHNCLKFRNNSWWGFTTIGVDDNDELDVIDDDLSKNSPQLDLLHCALSVHRSIKILCNEIP